MGAVNMLIYQACKLCMSVFVTKRLSMSICFCKELLLAVSLKSVSHNMRGYWTRENCKVKSEVRWNFDHISKILSIPSDSCKSAYESLQKLKH